MALAMTRPTRHPKSGLFRIRLTVPAALRDTTAALYGRRAEFIETLGTRDEREARHRAPAVVAKLQGYLRTAEAAQSGRTTALSDRDISALCGLWLAEQERLNRDNTVETTRTLEDSRVSQRLQGLHDRPSLCLRKILPRKSSRLSPAGLGEVGWWGG